MRPRKKRALCLGAGPAMLVETGVMAQPGPQSHPPPATAPEPEHPAIEPAAVEMLKATSRRSGGLKSMTFTVFSTYESIARTGQPLYLTTQSYVAVQHPNKLRVLTPGDGPASEFYYNGRNMIAFAPAEKLVAAAKVPATMEPMVLAAYDQAAIYVPFSSVLVSDPYRNFAEWLSKAFFVGQPHVVDGTVTDIVAFTKKNVQGEIWVGINDGLPGMFRVAYVNDPQHLRYEVDMFDWHVNLKRAPGEFTSAQALKAPHMQFGRPDAPFQETRK